MTNVWGAPGLLTFLLLTICTASYIRRVPTLRKLLLSEKSGFPGTLYKCSVIGTRLHWQVSLTCILLSMYLLFFNK
jgi:hypothetical protein